MCMVWSRAMDFKLSDGSVLRLIAPFGDMFNHSNNVEICHIYDQTKKEVRVMAGKDYNAKEQVCEFFYFLFLFFTTFFNRLFIIYSQVFINYGNIPNNRLVRLYGFVLYPNPHDSYDLVMTMVKRDDDGFYNIRAALLRVEGLEETITVPLTLDDPLPLKVLQYLRIQHLIEREFTTDTTSRVSVRNENMVLIALKTSLKSLLDSFGISHDVLEQNIINGAYKKGGNEWMAAVVSIGEQRVLMKSLEMVEMSLEYVTL
jgi:Rubisco LSMT substrate-binding